MTIVYFDGSAFVKLVVEEDGSEVAATLWDGCDAAVSSPWRTRRCVPHSPQLGVLIVWSQPSWAVPRRCGRTSGRQQGLSS